tara:strand:- start:406 stop:630 length:225 start_codon:yes stop_codon:yes gene_type:complete
MRYIIFEISKLPIVNFNQVYETDANTLRVSVDGDYTILKFKGVTPSFLEGYEQYTHTQIIEIINNPANGWITED